MGGRDNDDAVPLLEDTMSIDSEDAEPFEPNETQKYVHPVDE
jgi:hypothetical protein